MRKLDIAPLTQWITAAAADHPQDLADLVSARLAITRRGAQSLLRRLAAAQWLRHEGTARRPIWRPGALRQVVRHYPLEGLMEDQPWRMDFAPYFQLPAAVQRMAQHAFTELVNNAVEHSGGTQVTVSMRQTPAQLQLLVSDDGCGLFRQIEERFHITEPAVAMLELAKGRLTSQPQRHCGLGLLVTSQLADVFDVRANAQGYQRRAWSEAPWHPMSLPAALAERPGTSVYLAIALDTGRTLEAVQRALSADARSFAFDRTHVPLNLITGPAQSVLASRADARRVAARLAGFRRAEIDFTGLGEIGHAFAHELFDVYRRENPQVEIVAVGATPLVAEMLGAVGAMPVAGAARA